MFKNNSPLPKKLLKRLSQEEKPVAEHLFQFSAISTVKEFEDSLRGNAAHPLRIEALQAGLELSGAKVAEDHMNVHRFSYPLAGMTYHDSREETKRRMQAQRDKEALLGAFYSKSAPFNDTPAAEAPLPPPAAVLPPAEAPLALPPALLQLLSSPEALQALTAAFNTEAALEEARPAEALEEAAPAEERPRLQQKPPEAAPRRFEM